MSSSFPNAAAPGYSIPALRACEHFLLLEPVAEVIDPAVGTGGGGD